MDKRTNECKSPVFYRPLPKKRKKEKKKVMMKYIKQTDFIFRNCKIIEQLMHSLPFKPWDYLGQFLWR